MKSNKRICIVVIDLLQLKIFHKHYKYTVNKHPQVIIISNFFQVPLSFVLFDGIQISSLLCG